MSVTEANKSVKSSNNTKILTFNLDSAEYGVDIMIVKEIRGWSSTTKLPNSPESMTGVMNLRGNIVPIFDLRVRFAQGTTNPSQKSVFIILSVCERTIGIIVDAVSDILDVTADQIKPSPSSNNGIDNKFLSGLISINERMVMILSMEQLFGECIPDLSTQQV